jgi:hypothetical protein
MDLDEHIKLRLVHEIHTSERKSYRACRRRWDWIFRQNYYPVMTAKPLEFGTAFHSAAEVYYDPQFWDKPRSVMVALAIKKFVEVCESQKAEALKVADRMALDDDVEADYKERVELGKGMLDYHLGKIAPRLDVGWRPTHVEVAFMVPIPHPDTGELMFCKCDQCWTRWTAKFDYHTLLVDREPVTEEHARFLWEGLPVVYAGRIDMLAEDKHGGLWIFDWKTAARITVSGERDEFLYLDDQVGSYVWALRSIGLNVQGFVYHEMKKGFPQPPTQNKQPRLGCWFSKNKNQNTDYETYLKTVSEEDTEAWKAGLYDDMLQFLQAEGVVFYSRHQIMKSDHECVEIQKGIGMEALEMIDPNLRIYPSPGRFGCAFCAFRGPCLGVFAGEDYQYALDTMFEKREAYYLRKEPSTESKGAE